MMDNDKNKVIQRYNERLEKYGDDPKTLGWFKGRQPLRFKILAEIGILDGSSVLDVGCGFGDLFNFLRNLGINVNYTGIDINPDIIKLAREKNPELRFEVLDFDKEEIDGKFDWVVSSGIFNYKLTDNARFTRNMLEKMFLKAEKGIAADFMSTHVDYQEEETNYTDPEEIFKFCKGLSKRVVLRHDYLPFEFCIYVYKNDVLDGSDFAVK